MEPIDHLRILEELLKFYTGAENDEFDSQLDFDNWKKASNSIETLNKFIMWRLG